MTDVLVGEGRGWKLRWTDLPSRSGLLMLADDAFGHLSDRERLPVFALTGRIAWGLVAGHAVAVRIVDEVGCDTQVAIIGPDLGGRVAFAVELPDDARPLRLDVIDRSGAVVESVGLVPTDEGADRIGQRVTVRAVDHDAGARIGTVIGEGTVDDATWEHGVERIGNDLRTFWQSRSPSGGGRGSSSGPLPVAAGRHWLHIRGCGGSGDVWHLDACGGPSIDRAELRLTTGEVIEMPAMGRQLDLGVVFFSIGLPTEVRAAVLDGLDGSGEAVQRLWLAGHLSWFNASLDDRIEQGARARAPLPSEVLARWQSVFPGTDPVPSIDVPIRADEVANRWPIRPLLTPPASRGWALHGGHHRFSINQLIGISLVCQAAEGLDLTQGISWSSGEGTRDEPNTEVRGHRAQLEILTMRTSNIDEINLTWQEPSPRVDPFSGVWVSITGDPRVTTVDAVKALAESLTSEP